MPNLKCKICGTEFPPIRERHYISRDLTKTGLAAAFDSSDEPVMYDSYDCPCCGSQVIAQPRKRQYDPKSEEITDIVFGPDILDLIEKTDNPKTKPASLYFVSKEKARAALRAMQKFVEENGFISIGKVSEILGCEHHIGSRWGWTDLSKARVVESENCSLCYISFPSAICGRPSPREICDNDL